NSPPRKQKLNLRKRFVLRKFLLSFPVTYCIIKRCVVLFNISFYTLRSVPRIYTDNQPQRAQLFLFYTVTERSPFHAERHERKGIHHLVGEDAARKNMGVNSYASPSKSSRTTPRFAPAMNKR
ncbi:hypothetical protein, partial [Bacteroides uniformis]|uniref:hypothetical protein n=1 Tax=Bacteroides uniformis TaxID=820 RepID=UPI001BB1E20B